MKLTRDASSIAGITPLYWNDEPPAFRLACRASSCRVAAASSAIHFSPVPCSSSALMLGVQLVERRVERKAAVPGQRLGEAA